MSFRTLDETKISTTTELLRQRIAERFPDSGLAEVAGEVVQVARDAFVRAEGIRRPFVWLRVGLLAGAGLLLAVALLVAWLLARAEGPEALRRVDTVMNTAQGSLVYVVAVLLFLVSLEVRLKRRRALKAVHELRALAHVIDMHQLAKDPDRLGLAGGPVLVSGRVMNAADLNRYLHYCTELLSLLSKIGQLYVQHFPDSIALAAVDQMESLATGLSGKIWQKLMIVDRILADAAEKTPGGADGVAVSGR